MKSPIDDKVRYWQSMLEKWKDSGLSQMAFSMHEGIDSRRLAYWKKALIDRGLFTDRVSVSKAAKLQESVFFASNYCSIPYKYFLNCIFV